MIYFVSDDGTWMDIISRMRSYDVFHMPQYSHVFASSDGPAGFKEHFSGEPLLLHYTRAGCEAAYPLLIRDIPNTNLRDLVSPYGYSGVLSRGKVDWSKFKLELKDVCSELGIVSEFDRLHPFASPRLNGSEKKGAVVYLILCQDLDDIKKGLSKPCRNSISKAIRSGVSITRSTLINPPKEDIDTFYSLYTDTMRRNNASERYFFSKDFFYKLFSYLKDNALLFSARYEGKVIASAIFLFSKPYFNYFLAGSLKEYSNLCANNLLLWDAIIYAKQNGFIIFNLGGIFSDKKSLLDFKKGFSPTEKPFYIYKRVFMLNKYKELSGGNNSEEFFPAYRK